MIESRFRHGLTRRLSRYSILAAAALPAVSWAATFNPTTSTQFQTDLNNCALGDTIVLQAGTTYTGSFTLPNKTTGSGYVTIQSSALASLPAAGTRVTAAHAGNMPKIQMANAFGSAIGTLPGAHHYKMIGLQVVGPTVDAQPDGISNITYPIIRLGESSGTSQDTLAEVPNNIIIERCLVRANSATQRLKVGITINSASTDIKDSTVSGIHAVGQDCQAVAGVNGPGPFNIINNYLEGSTENFMLGGSDPSITNLIPSNLVFTKNHVFKPLSWQGTSWSVKNIFELKNARDCTIEGNIFENNWVMGQDGTAILFTVRNQDGNAPWCDIDNVMFRNNILRNTANGYNILGVDDNHPSGMASNITIENNLNYNVGGAQWGGGGRLNQLLAQTDAVRFKHNTSFHTGNVMSVDGGADAHTNFQYTDNLHAHNSYGVIGSDHGVGNDSLNYFFANAVFTKNVLMGGSSSAYNQYAGNFFPASWTGVLVNQGTPGSNFAGWKVVTGSAYDNSGTDGKDIGCDIDAILTATQGCISGVWPGGGGGGGGGGGTTTVTLKNGVNGYTGATSFSAWGQSPTTHFGASAYHTDVNQLSGTNAWAIRTFYKFDLNQGANAIPSGATIQSASLKVKVEYSNDPANKTMSIHRVSPVGGFTVNYATATRNTYNGTNSWTGGANMGGDVANSNNDFLDTPDGTAQLPAGGGAGDMVFNVAPSVQAWVNGTANNGWIILTSPDISTVYMGTPADLHGSADYPELTITYSTSAPSTTVTFKNGVSGYNGATSFSAWGQYPTTHFGASAYHTDVNQLAATNAWAIRSFFKFDVSSIPSGKTIDSATLKVKVEYSNNPANRTMSIHRVSPVGGFTVNYATATRNTYNGSNSWTGGANMGGDVANSNNDFVDTADSTALLPAGGAAGDMTFDVKNSVQAWVNGTANNGWIILTSPDITVVYMGTPADLHGSADYPELTVTYH